MAKATAKKDKFITDAFKAYFGALCAIEIFEQWICSVCQRIINEYPTRFQEEMGIEFDVLTMKQDGRQVEGDEVWIGSTMESKSKSGEVWISVGLKCSQGMGPSAYASLHFGLNKMTAEKLCEELKRYSAELEEDNGWYVSIYQELSQLSQPGFESALRNVLGKWCSGRGKVRRFLRANPPRTRGMKGRKA